MIALQFKVTSEGQGLFQLPDYSPSLSEVRAVTQDKKVEAEEAEIREKHCVLASYPRLAHTAFFYNPGPLVQVWSCPQLNEPSYLNH